MSWVKVQPESARKGAQVTITISVGSKGNGKLHIAWPTAESGRLGFDEIDRAEVLMGQGDHAGQAMVVAATEGAFGVTTFKTRKIVRMPVMKGVALKHNTASVDYKIEEGGLTFSLPKWALPIESAAPAEDPDEQAAVSPPSSAKPGSLEVTKTQLILGSKTLELMKHEVAIMKALVACWGQCVTRDDLRSALEASGGAGTFTIDAWIPKLNRKMATANIDLLIMPIRGQGWELRRPVA